MDDMGIVHVTRVSVYVTYARGYESIGRSNHDPGEV